MVSVVICHRNEEKYIWRVVDALLKDVDSTRFEIIIVDDCSDEVLELSPTYTNVKIVRSPLQKGVGYSFDRGVEQAKYDSIVLMASDVIVKDSSWIDVAEEFSTSHPKSLGCSCCIELDPDHLNPSNPPEYSVKRYGANLLLFSMGEDLPIDSPVRNGKDYYVGCFDSKWIKTKPEEDISEIAVIYGAFYICNKTWYTHIQGWNTERGVKMSGHRNWGSLEPWISIKSWLSGGTCHSINYLETGHIFHKFVTEDGVVLSNNNRGDMLWWNKFFLAYMVMDTEDATCLVEKVISSRKIYELYIKQPTEGRRLIKYHWDYVMKVRESNKKLFIHDLDWLCEKFNINKEV
jgi:glycosyltransferase involved in cell wall biosynthesis